MDGILLKAEAHEDGFAAEDLLESGNNGDTAATAGCQRTFAEGHLETMFSRAIGRDIDRADVTLTAMHRRDNDAYALRRD